MPYYDVDEIHSEVLQYLNENLPYFATHFLQMGRPIEVDNTPYAYVRWLDDDLQFCMNAKNLGPMEIEDKVFICMHETLHVFLRHDLLTLPNKQKLNIAADIVINDYLRDHGVDTSIEGLCFGPAMIGYSCSELPVTEVYRLLPEDDDSSVDKCGFSGHGHGDQSGSGGGADPGDQSSGGGTGDIPADVDLGDAPADNFAGNQLGGSAGYSTTGIGTMDKWVEKTGTSLKWAELLKDVRPDMFRGSLTSHRVATFSRLHRKVAWDAPRTLLPVSKASRLEGDEEEGHKPIVVIAVDVSGSISHDTRSTFITLVNSIPDNLIVGHYCTFNTNAVEFEKGAKTLRSGGGTDFTPIELFARKRMENGKYPDAVVVLTDGDAGWSGTSPSNEDYSKWIWLLSDVSSYRSGSPLRVPKGSSRVEDLKTFMK